MKIRNSGFFFLVMQLVFCTVAFSDDAEFKPWFSHEKTSENGVFLVTLEAGQSEVQLNNFHHWFLTVVDAKTRQPVSPLRTTVDGGMPLHGHGLPSQPLVGKYLGKGRYEVKGVQFNMTGEWVLAFGMSAKTLSDQVKFELTVDY